VYYVCTLPRTTCGTCTTFLTSETKSFDNDCVTVLHVVFESSTLQKYYRKRTTY
jgi:hypothetical protein